MSTWTEIRHMHVIDGVPKKEIARRLGINIKTVRRALQRTSAPTERASPPRARQLDSHREEIVSLLAKDERLSAKRIGRLLEIEHGVRFNARTIRRYVNDVRGATKEVEAFVHRTHLPGETMEIDFGESWVEIDGRRSKVFFFVAALPASNVYFAKAYAFQRIECLLDGITSAIEWLGGVPNRLVFDNASMAVKKVLKGTKRIETELFEAYRGEWPTKADFCNPASGWEKGSVERGVDYVRGLFFRPMPSAASFNELNAQLLAEIELDIERRALRGGRSIADALREERRHLRPMPRHIPIAAKTISCASDKYGHVHIDRSTYSVSSHLARRSMTAHLYHDRVEIACDGEVVATHGRSLEVGAYVLNLEHTLDLLEAKPRAAMEATVIRQMGLPKAFFDLREALRQEKRRSDKEWVQIVHLLIDHPLEALLSAVEGALASGSPGIDTIKHLLRFASQPRIAFEPVELDRDELASIAIAQPDLADWDFALAGGMR